MLRGAQILIAVALAIQVAGTAGCAEETVFNLRVQPPSAACPPTAFGAYVVLTWEGTDFVGCEHGPCPPGAQQPLDCLAGVETDAIEAGRALRIKAMLYADPPGFDPVLCGDATTPSADLEMSDLPIKLECGDSCPEPENFCKPAVCGNDQRTLCPEFRQ